jgi:hypothetical protein
MGSTTPRLARRDIPSVCAEQARRKLQESASRAIARAWYFERDSWRLRASF